MLQAIGAIAGAAKALTGGGGDDQGGGNEQQVYAQGFNDGMRSQKPQTPSINLNAVG